MSNPFDWKNQPSKISMKDVDYARHKAGKQTVVINKRRAEGIEPSIIYSTRSNQGMPRKFVAEMPELPYSKWTKTRKEDRND